VLWHLQLSHAGRCVGELVLALPHTGFARDALTRRITPLIDTAAALVGALLEQRGHAPPASLSVARAAMREAGTFVWEWDIASDTLGDIDEGALMLGYAPHQVGHTQADWNRLIHPDDAEASGIVDGDYVVLGNTRGEVRLHAKIYPGVRRGVLIAESIWPNAAYADGCGINTLVGADSIAPYGGAAVHDNKVWVRRLSK
jgi:formylmethanofuran dehydrogenase subunit D